MSSSSATASGSRSPSPATPESSDSPPNTITIQNDFELPAWYGSLQTDDTVPNATAWHNGGSPFVAVGKSEEQSMLQFDDLIDEQVYDESSPYMGIDSSPLCPVSVESKMGSNIHSPVLHTPTQSMHVSNTLVPLNLPVSHTKPIPPPAARPRKRESFAAFQRIVFPPKESCYNLPIMVPSIPEGGTKSRVETQVRVTVDLAHASSSSGEPFKYDRVGSWKWLKLPSGTATKRRTRKEGKIDATPEDMLYLTASVTCASPPHNPVLSCGSCQTREAKRVARKLAARVRPTRSDSDSPEDAKASSKSKQEDTTSIVQFNCPDILDFSTGSVVLPLRITCYCRHHREKVGFNVHFTMMDHNGRIVGAGTSRPIMITDDHKTVNANKQGVMSSNGLHESDIDWSQFGRIPGSESKAPSKRKQTKEPGQVKKRIKPYDTASRSVSAKVSRETSIASLPPSSIPSTRPQTPSHYYGPETMTQVQDISSCALPMGDADTPGVSPSDTIHQQPDQLPTFDMREMIGPITHQLEAAPPIAEHLCPAAIPPNTHYTPNGHTLVSSAPLLLPPQPMPYMFFDPGSPPPISSLPLPKIHRLIPATGPMAGGIEVTILGANFHPAMSLSCVFGEAVAGSTQRWSDNTLVCILPPRASPGIVAVWFDGIQKDNDDNSAPSLFNYTDESDRALMELALQVVGLKMTGKIEDAKNVAMRIVGTSATDELQGDGDTRNMMQLALTSYRDIRPLLLTRVGDSEDFESVIVEFLSVLDVPVDQSNTTISSAISHTTSSGQTLLHLAAILGFSVLTQFLIKHEIDLDARDRNGYTALHFTTVSGSRDCARLLVQAGADLEIVNVLGKTAQEQAPAGFFEEVFGGSDYDEDSVDAEDDEESRWGDAEEEEEELVVPLRRSSRRATHRCDEASSTNISDQKHLESLPGAVPSYPKSDNKRMTPDAVDEKQTAWFVDMIQRTIAQLHAPQGIIPNMPQFPLPHLPEMPAVPWGALQQIPVAFPVFVPMPGWPSFLGEKRDGEQGVAPGQGGNLQSRVPTGSSAIRAAQEWRATCEKWMALAMATATMRQEDAPPPMYTPRASTDETRSKPARLEPEDEGESSSTTTARPRPPLERPVTRRFGYPPVPITDQDVKAYAYRPAKTLKRLQTKNDRMLVYFWIPILLLSLLWAFFTSVRYAYTALKTSLPSRSMLRG